MKLGIGSQKNQPYFDVATMWRYRVDVVPNLSKCPVPVWCCTELTEVSGAGVDIVPIPVQIRYKRQYRYRRYRCWCHTELAEVSGTGIDVQPNLPKCPVPHIDVVPNLPKCPVLVLMMYRTFREVSGTGIDVPNLPKCPVPAWKSGPVPAVPVLISYQTYTGVSDTGIYVVPNLPKCPVPVIPAIYIYRLEASVRNIVCRAV